MFPARAGRAGRAGSGQDRRRRGHRGPRTGSGELLNIAGGSQSRSLNQLVGLVSRQVPACSGATSALWRAGEPVVRAASHPDLAELFELQLRRGAAPWLDALVTNSTVACPDTLEEERWPGFATAALSRGVRCSVTLVHTVRAVRDHADPVRCPATLAGRRNSFRSPSCWSPSAAP